ncbi:hypothetical protein G3570_00640 [Balneolaceae bacterium YR4-1]|uniref:Uncharacterized protein n=1 Tax=Halalkalibaculum roseum TaxID=2709311 RepID=A0A6M1SIE0_9BACT|nr:hypothetical protein [Halalkalibaculum roseum]NGP75121.1 hypothetical protein [Halalkalibaculum roseum]
MPSSFFAQQSQEAQTLKGRIVAQVSQEDMKIIDVGDVSGHSVMLLRAKGLAFLENGEVAEVTATEIIDDINGNATYWGYEILTFEDGSTVANKFEGNSTTSRDGKFVDFEGTFTYTQGTGRFAGIEGSGTHEGRNYASSGAGFYVNFEGTFTLSSN